MAERVYPSTKPTTIPNSALNSTGAAAASAFPTTKSQLYGATRPAYRPSPLRKRSRRSLCCSCCLWLTLIIFILLILAVAAGAIVYFIYQPHHPNFAVSGFKISSLNLTSNSHLITNININITAKNPNKKMIYIYNPTEVEILTVKDEILIGNGSVPGFVHRTKNTTLLKAAIRSGNTAMDDVSASQLKSDLKSKGGLNLKIRLETKVKVKLDSLKSPKVGIRVICDGIKANVPSGKTATTASVANAKCKVDLRIKIWKWTF
ncbi:Late embryogenesis abundant (LEA) hydroxyproline-rich glycoprotein family [Euphorbia peplus]|nr:Late embryogenesis abundant (LEA) hydroxyproline-rich glycoprotein family [Euphorbia peplus]